MKQLEEELGRDRAIEIETDDEENEAERVCHDLDNYDTESNITGPSRAHSDDCLNPDPANFWPQSYRDSMDMFTGVTPPTVSFLKGKGSSFFLASEKASQSILPESSSSLYKPLISPLNSDLEIGCTSLPHINQPSVSEFTASFSDEQPHREKCTYTQSVLNAVNALCGIGVLSTPYALKEGGWFSIGLLFLFGAITCYTGLLLKKCLDSSPRLKTYPDIGHAAFGLTGRILIAVILYVELYSSCVEYLIMMSDNLSASFPNMQMDVFGIHLDSYQICAIISALIILPTVWLRNLRLLSYISVGGVVTLVLVVACLVWAGVSSDVGFHPTGKAIDFPNLPITIGIFSFCYGSHSVFPNIYSSMREPSRFPSVLIISFVTAGFLYAGVAVFGYSMFGEAIKPQFTLNLPTNLEPSKIAGWAVVVAPLTKFGLSMTPVALGLEELLPSSYIQSTTMSLIIRTTLVFSTLIVALTVPYFGSVMALIGSLLVMLVSVVLPCASSMRIHAGRLSKLEIITSTAVIIMGICFAMVGTYSAVSSMGN
ncbi:hypothetical protein ABFS82_10G029900 [Erythranthe guttata]